MTRVMLAVLLLTPQEKKEYEFSWALAPEEAADYAVSDWKGGKPVPRKDKFFLIFGTELTAEGGNNLVVNSYSDIGYKYLFQLPKGKVKPGSKWPVDDTLFYDARLALTQMHDFDERKVLGQYVFRKIEKVQDVDCALIEGQFSLWEVKIDDKDKRTLGKKQLATLSTVQWLSLEKTVLMRGAWSISGEGQEFKGIKQGEEPKRTKLNLAEHLEIRKDRIALDLKVHNDGIKKAIARGVAWLKSQQTRNGSYVDDTGSFARDFPVGTTALCLMALLHSGVKADDPVLRQGFAYIQGQQFRKVYDVAATLMLFETKYLPLEQIEDVAALEESKAREMIQKALTPEDKAYVQKAADWLLANQTKMGTWGYPEASDRYDHSNTQYALLGLKSASRLGVKIRAEVWKRIADHWFTTMRIGGGKKVPLRLEYFSEGDAGVSGTKEEETFDQATWGYFVAKPSMMDIPDQGYGSMTCAGLTSLIIAESELFALKEIDDTMRKRFDTAKKQGLAWLQENYTVRGCPPSAGFWSVFYMYYLYSLERVGVLYGIRKIRGHDWYLEGAILLVRYQREDGSWVSYDEIAVLDTAFALLFLKKATMKVATK